LALQLIADGTHYFLSRPRRFGKSLLLDTMKELFEGNQALFAGLYAEAHWDWSQRHPVLLLNLANGVLKTREELHAELHEQLDAFERVHNVPPTMPDLRSRLKRLIRGLHEKTGQRVVVLVDEYDKPILDNLTTPDTARIIRDALRDVYSVLKGTDAHLRFVFITGVSKLSKVSLFSGLNNLNDITVTPEYSALCGYTEHDVDTVFAPELPGLDRPKIRQWYNGYNWRGEAVYNPFDLLLLFDKREFKAYWFETDTPAFLVEMLAQRQFFTPEFTQLQTSEALLSSFNVDHIETEALLFQAGYLTIQSVKMRRSGRLVYTLCLPYLEVAAALNDALLPILGPAAQAATKSKNRLEDALEAHDMPAAQEAIHALFASIPHDWYRKNALYRSEGHYASVFFSYLMALGYAIRVEDATNKGRIDLALCIGPQVFLFEFKVVDQAPDGSALAQLQTRGYAEKYREPGVTITLVGIEFSREARNLVSFVFATTD
jgi:hypothetical protein